MRKSISTFLLLMSLCVSSWAQSNNIVSEASPKLKKFLLNNPEAANVFTNAIANTFSNRTVQLFYFYSDDDSKERAYHFYPHTVGSPDVMLCIRENQTPLDEFITTLFEMLNTKREAAFTKLMQNAYYGRTGREQFAREILQNEFEAVKNIRSTLLMLKFGTNEINEAHYYHKFIECPTNFDAFLTYAKKNSPDKDAMNEYELRYDSLRKTYFDSISASNSVAPKN